MKPAAKPTRRRKAREEALEGKMVKKYALHPGYVISRNDGDEHYIGEWQLQRLYGVQPNECVLVGPGVAGEGLIHLRPRYDGNYTLPTRQRGAR